jgi:outer membrane protein TolC
VPAHSSTSLFSGPHRTWSAVPQVTQPIFTAGRMRSGVRFARAVREHALVQYEKVIETAFTEVSDALIAHQRTRESREKQELLVAALEDRSRLAYMRYRGGVDTQLNALVADRDLFSGQPTWPSFAFRRSCRWSSCTRRSPEAGNRAVRGV